MYHYKDQTFGYIFDVWNLIYLPYNLTYIQFAEVRFLCQLTTPLLLVDTRSVVSWHMHKYVTFTTSKMF